MFDLLITGCMVADGTGAPIFRSNIAVKDGRIAAVGLEPMKAERVIDADGLVAAPGFIDIHSHTDAGVLVEPTCQSKITQGVTTEISGNCGSSSAPVLSESGREQLNHWRETNGIEEEWTTMREFLDVLERHAFAVNFATYVGHSDIRSGVIGMADREATPSELEEMRKAAAQAMAEGAFGLSTGLIYAPSCFAGTDEIVELARSIRPYGGIYASHIRSEGDGLLDAVAEAITIGREAGVPVQISHHKACGSSNWGRVRETLGMIDEAKDSGLDVNCDQYPYIASATSLSTVLPQWAHDGGRPELVRRLKEMRGEIVQSLKEATAPGGWIANDGGWKSVVVSGVATEGNKRFEGKSIPEIAEMVEKDPIDAVIDLLIEEDSMVGMIHFAQSEDDVRTIMRHSAAMIGTDASARAQTGPTSRGKPHPRSYGTYPRVLGRYVRENSVIPLEFAVAKMTSMPARKLGIPDRGVIAPGNWADITIFSPDAVADTATYADPHQIAKGIRHVIVNGRVATEDGELTGALAGKVLRRNHVGETD